MPSRKENITYRSLLTEAIRSDGEYGQLMSELRTRRKKNLPLMATGLCRGASIALCAAVCEDMPDRAPVLFLCPEERDCLSLCGCFDVLGIKAGFYPLRDFNFNNVTSSREFEQQRLRVLAQISRGELNAVVSTPDAVLQYTVPKEKLPEFTVEIGTDSCIPPDELCAKLTKAGYVRSEMAEGPGQYARRGGIIDICMPGDSADSASSGNALRIEFFDDEIDRMCFFDPATQRVTGNTPFAVIPPAREVIPGAEALAEIEKSISSLLKKASDPEILGRLGDELSAVKLCRSSGSELNFADKYISLIYPGKACLLDWLPSSSLHVHVGNAAVSERLKSYLWRLDEETKDMVESGLISGKYALYSERDNKLNFVPEDGKVLLIDSLMQGMTGREVAGIFGFRTKHSTGIAGSNDMLLDELSDYSAGGYRMVFMAGGNTQAQNYASLIAGRDIPARASDRPDGSDIPLSIMQKGSAAVIPSSPVPPFELPGPRIAFISAAADYERPREKRRAEKTSKKSEAARILSYADLKPGDYVVHENHGIGIFDGITTVTTAGVTADYIAIRYAGTDRLYLPVDKLDKISKYIGAKSDDGTLKLSKFGGTEWGKTKARAKAALKDIAKDLIKLYAERLRRPGFAFPADDDFQRDFETAFEYDETDAQLKAAGEIKRDMERPVPMDRLLCGDVGYGKTEVAFRAIYKAICGGRQVALLVPTTILAMQHFQTAESRMRPFCVNTGVLSRFVPSKEQKRVISGAESGDIDLLIGTHRLLSKDIKFKNLGLLVIDEEQRFGVAQKEKIKQMAGNIDVLSLSATPIPRTLNMAMTGIRDISLLDEAPVDRLPVQTYVLEHDDLIITEAIKRELRRGGQVFYLYNFVDSIDIPAAKIKAAIPEARIAVAHGKMEKEQLEDIWQSMVNGDIDVLISTTIIETGIDIPNANTLIVENAHRMGLSQLHQLRGRVGRSPRRAYAYFTFPRGRALTEIAQKRLEAVRDYAEFGAGFRIALRDLELRGAGSVLGAEQHGHLDSVGYDLYVKLMNEAILEEKGETPQTPAECTVNLGENAFIPEYYVDSSAQRMSLYRRIANIRTKADRDDVFDELIDRFGEPPAPAVCLLDTSLIRALAQSCGITSVIRNGGDVIMKMPDPDFPVWQNLSAQGFRLRAIMSDDPGMLLMLKKKDSCIPELTKLMKKLAALSGKSDTEE